MRPTIHFDVETISADECYERYQRSAAALHACGIGERDVFALMLHNEPVMLELMLAGRWLGARWCLINWHFQAQEVGYILTDSAAKVLIIHADLLRAVRDGIAFVGNQHRVTLQHVHQLVMLQMGMAQCGDGVGGQPCQIHAKVRKSKQVAQWPFLVANDS
jgi:acyl-coenzyme A synthetase/AMP-(fatty) acid ligase